MAAGTISSVTTRIAPTDSNAVTAVTATATSSSRASHAGGMPAVRENSGSKLVALSSFHSAAISDEVRDRDRRRSAPPSAGRLEPGELHCCSGTNAISP